MKNGMNGNYPVHAVLSYIEIYSFSFIFIPLKLAKQITLDEVK